MTFNLDIEKWDPKSSDPKNLAYVFSGNSIVGDVFLQITVYYLCPCASRLIFFLDTYNVSIYYIITYINLHINT